MMLVKNKPADAVTTDVAMIRKSGLFDVAFYESEAGRQADPIRHYLTQGEAKDFAPSRLFDPKFYRLTNPDVRKSGVALLPHYLRYGRAESRYPRRSDVARDAERLKSSGLFDPPPRLLQRKWFGYGLPSLAGGPLDLSPIEQCLVGWRFGYRTNGFFDDDFYCGAYDDVAAYGHAPIIHYLDIGQKQHRLVNRGQLDQAASQISSAFDAAYYRRQAGLADDVDAIRHYLTVGRFCGFDPSPDFSVAYYLRAYPDIDRAGVDPFTHYMVFGGKEKRTGRPQFTKTRRLGQQIYDSRRPSVLIVNHDASRTGAPLVGFEVARQLSQDHNVFVYSMRAGELLDEITNFIVQLNFGPCNSADAEYFLQYLKADYQIDAIILNSAETSTFASAALYEGIPSVALIHEFAEYTLPPGRASKIVAAVDRVVVPAKIILESLQRELEWQFGARSSNIVVRPQGCLPDLPGRGTIGAADLTTHEILTRISAAAENKPPIVLGAGFVHMRKGVELFVQAAREVRRQIPDVKFIWVGSGYTPNNDSTYSVWISEMVRRLDLESTVFFLPSQSQLDVLFELSDAFFLSSRLDPFPSVVLDAFEAGKQVVCFQQATGAAELLETGQARGAVVEYANAREAGEALIKILASPAEEAARVNRELVEQQFSFDKYVVFLKQQIREAQTARAEDNKIRERIIASGAFDATYHEGAAVAHFEAGRPCQDYVSRAAKTLLKFNPRPGFSDGIYRNEFGLKPGEVPLDHALGHEQNGDPPATHRCVELRPNMPRVSTKLRAALHLHLYYTDLAQESLARLNAASCPIDLFVTTSDETKRDELSAIFADYRHGRVSCTAVGNRGRDIGPLLTDLKVPIAGGTYDIVGHLHGKRSLAVDPAMGERWRTYLLDTLLGDTFAQLTSLFAADEKLGLVFAEDRHAAGWNANYDIAKSLAERARPSFRLPAYPVFPLGTMFWARPAALAPLWSLDLKPDDFPAEPVPYDGTILHALERVLPAACEAAGLGWCTVYDRRYSW